VTLATNVDDIQREREERKTESKRTGKPGFAT
jgi:hypothetical protein